MLPGSIASKMGGTEDTARNIFSHFRIKRSLLWIRCMENEIRSDLIGRERSSLLLNRLLRVGLMIIPPGRPGNQTPNAAENR